MATEYVTQGQRIARARHRKGWDQATLAEKIGRSVSWLSKVENGPRDDGARLRARGRVAGLKDGQLVDVLSFPASAFVPEAAFTGG
ncbi:helix-turn-helix domain-containing protein [Nonomuraea turcica]|uniref:helix-turn-helix domain-containing protein n=1 Tax=Nonomuraea sp. G32 TaxID=3067274 RepID=UPI00273C0AC7|nr:helix-turn-helix transcriptional regulator [Nonomuraea sp. G32]MDP4512087.1 helix-turn-helix transcriptional regulator [Nonomuraea sp. G32]